MKGLFIYDNALDDKGVEITAISGGSRQGRHPDAVIDGCPHNQWGPSPYGPLETWVKIDLGSEQTIKAAGFVNHNFYAAALSYVAIGGNNDGGSSYTLVDMMTGLSTYDHDPCTAMPFTSPPTYRYWRFNFAPSTYGNVIGGFYLAREVYEFAEAPDAPFGEEQHGQIVFDETAGGSERRQVRGEPYYDRTLRWKCVSAATALEFRKMWLRQHGRSRPFLYVAHDKDQPTAQDYYIPEHVRFAGLTIRELEPGGGYSVMMTLTGLLRIDY